MISLAMRLAKCEIQGEDKRIRQPGFVVGSVELGAENDIAIVLHRTQHFHSDIVAEDFALGPCLDRGLAPELTPDVVDQRIILESRNIRHHVGGVAGF
jgi:hypothetical protein